jgi:dATP pyrophosphohydrolase
MNIRHDMVACNVIRPDAAGASHEFLQVRRRAGDYMGGTWQVVYGTSEKGETAWQAALRELFEETGLRPVEFYRLSQMEQFYIVHDDTIWNCPNFVAIVDRDAAVVLNDEHDAYRWISRSQIDAETMWATQRAIVAEIMREILDGGLARQYMRIDPAT